MLHIYDMSTNEWSQEDNSLDLVLQRCCGALFTGVQCPVCGRTQAYATPAAPVTQPPAPTPVVEDVVVPVKNEVAAPVTDTRKPGRPRKAE